MLLIVDEIIRLLIPPLNIKRHATSFNCSTLRPVRARLEVVYAIIRTH